MIFSPEEWSAVLPEMERLWADHWAEVAIDRDSIRLAPNYDEYAAMERLRMLAVVTARTDNGTLVGYHVTIIKPHLHYENDLFGFVDMYYIAPDHRKGIAGLKLFREAERHLKERGVRKIVVSTKIHLDISPVLRRLDYSDTERLFTKVI